MPPAGGRRGRFGRVLRRALRLRCPVCGEGPLFTGPFTPAARCARCGFVFARNNEYGHEGYYTGAIAINLVVTGVVPLVALFVLVLTTRLSVMELTILGVAWTILFPILFYRHACALWVVIDHTLNPPTPAELAAGAAAGAAPPAPLASERDRRR